MTFLPRRKSVRVGSITTLVIVVALAGWASLHQAQTAPPGQRGPATRLANGRPDTTLLWGPEQVTSNHATNWFTEVHSVSIPGFDAAKRYYFRITNGDTASGANRVSQVSIVVGGREFMNSSDITTSVSACNKIVSLSGSQDIYLGVRGAVGSYAKFRLYSVPDPAYAINGGTYVIPTEDGFMEFDETVDRPSDASAPWTLVVDNGDPNGNNRCTSVRVQLNGVWVVPPGLVGSGTASISRQVTLSASNNVTVRIYGAQDARAALTWTATDTTAPSMNLTRPIEGYVTDSMSIATTATLSDLTPPMSVVVYSLSPFTATAGFSVATPLATEGLHTIAVSATDRAGYTKTITRHVFRDTQSPILDVTSPALESQSLDADSVLIAGTWDDLTATTVTVDGDTIAPADTSGEFSVKVPLDVGPNRILVRARDAVGHETNVWRYVNRVPENEDAPDANVNAPLATESGIGSFYESVQFLLDSHQTGELENAVAPEHAAVVRGQVTARDFGALPNVVVRVLGQEDTLGQTLTREDGRFDLLVNGGRSITLRFSKPGYLESQRTLDVPVNDFVTIDELAMIGKSSRSTSANLANSAPTVRSRFESDENGDRHLTMLFRQGTQASVVTAPGDTTALPDVVTVRAKEFTVGSSGLATMPAMLPASTAYTYCIDLSLDEADALATPGQPTPAVRFDKPIPCYVKDFLQLPIGTPIPAGYYDPMLGRWVASKDGCVIKLLGVDAGLAIVDADSIPGADSDGHLDSLGFEDSERQRLAQQYAVGDTLWRVQVDHFSSWDFNLNLAWLAYSDSPVAARARRMLGLSKCRTERPGSIIDCENRVLGEEIPVVGTPYTLNYRSYRVPGDAAMRKVRVPLRGPTLPAEVDRIFVVLDVAGQQLRQEFSPQADSVTEFTWDGLDAYGRPVEGSVTAQVSVGYRYSQVYALAAGPGSSLGDPATNGTGSRATAGDRATGRIVWSRQRVSVGAPSMASAGLGSWTLSSHHTYDMSGSGTLYLGDGGFRSGDEMYPIISRFAGSQAQPNTQVPPANGASALSTPLAPVDIAIGPDGLLFFINQYTRSIHRISQEGQLFHVAGNGGDAYNGDGILATQAALGNPTSLAIGPDGSIYFTSEGQFTNQVRVRKVTPDGYIHTIAGDGQQRAADSSGFGDGGPATAARFLEPRGIALGPDGSVFVGDASGDARVRRIAPNGLISTYAGNGITVSPANQMEGRATQVSIAEVQALAVDRDGVLYIADGQRVLRVGPDGDLTKFTGISGNFRARGLALAADGGLLITSTIEARLYRRDPDGTLQSIAGVGVSEDRGNIQDLSLAAGAFLFTPRGVAVGQDGSIYVTEVNRIRRISTMLPSRTAGEFRIPAEDGTEQYVFDPRGRHLRTLDALTGAVLRRFTYDAAGRLTAIIDANNDQTTILRTPGGAPTGIESPYGLVTGLTLKHGKYLETITNPNNETITLDPSTDGLLNSLRDAKDQLYSFEYDADGRLESDTDPLLGTQTLTTVETGNERKVTHRSALQRESVHFVKRYFDGYVRHTVTGPDNFRSIYVDSTDGGGQWIAHVSPAGDSVRIRRGKEPRFGMLAAVDSGVTAVFPDGLKHHVAVERPYNPTTFDPPTVASSPWSEEVSVNSKPVATTSFTINGGTRTLVSQSAAGRAVTTTVDSAGRPLTLSVPGFAQLTLDFDTRGRIEQLTQGTRQWTWEHEDSGRVFRVTDPEQRETVHQYDPAGRLVRQTLPGARVVSFAYDANGNLTGLKPPGRDEHVLTPTAMNFLGAYTPPTLGQGPTATTYEYNLDRQLQSVARPGGDSILVDYDGAGRLWKIRQARGTTTVGYSSTTGQVQSIVSPDTVSLMFTYNGSLPTGESWDGPVEGSVTREHNPELLPRTETVTVGATTSTVEYEYDEDGLLTRVDLPGGASYTVSRLPEAGTSEDNGLVDSTQVGDVVESRGYNAHGELTNLRYRYGSTVLLQQSLTRDELGRVIHLTETVGGVTRETDYDYDAAGRLETVTVAGDAAASRLYVYDDSTAGNGNRTAEKDGTGAVLARPTYDAQDRMLTYGAASYTYSAAGELTLRATPDDTLATVYDALGNLVSAGIESASVSEGTTITYQVDGLNRRVRRLIDGDPAQGWLYRDALHPVAELDDGGELKHRYVYGTRGHVPDLIIHGDTAVYRMVTDHLGSVRAVVRTTDGAIVQRVDYDAWGVKTLAVGVEFQSLGYAGGLTDPGTGLVRFGARDYEPEVGRWNSKDPSEFMGGSNNLYEYVGSAPLNYVDPSGLRASLPDATRLKILYSSYCAQRQSAYTVGDAAEVSLDALAAFLDGAIPWRDPLAKHGWYDPTDETYSPSREIGVLTRDVLIVILTNARARVGFDRKLHDFGGRVGKQPHYQMDVWLDRVKGSHTSFRIPQSWWRR